MINEDLDSIINRALNYMERTIQDVDEAAANGKAVILVSCTRGTRRGDIIDVAQVVPEGEEEERQQARVLAVNPVSGMYKEYDALCVILEPGDITTEEEFAALYTEEEVSEEAQEEALDPDTCSCGADKIMCKRNQNVFGGHLEP